MRAVISRLVQRLTAIWNWPWRQKGPLLVLLIAVIAIPVTVAAIVIAGGGDGGEQQLRVAPSDWEKVVHDPETGGRIISDEVHLLPAPVFRFTAEIQATRRLGLTATLVREDEKEDEVFTLIGPKRYDVPWKVLERQGFIAPATCTEVRVPMEEHARSRYAVADRRQKFRLASENSRKLDTLVRVLKRHDGDHVLVIGQYLRQLQEIAKVTGAPIITGRTPSDERADLYGKFRRGENRLLIVSKVGNFAIDLPDANVLVQVSGTYGSRQEEAQRLGRILRPKRGNGQAHFYSLVTRDTLDQEYAQRRQLFLTEQGYSYRILDDREVA